MMTGPFRGTACLKSQCLPTPLGNSKDLLAKLYHQSLTRQSCKQSFSEVFFNVDYISLFVCLYCRPCLSKDFILSYLILSYLILSYLILCYLEAFGQTAAFLQNYPFCLIWRISRWKSRKGWVNCECGHLFSMWRCYWAVFPRKGLTYFFPSNNLEALL